MYSKQPSRDPRPGAEPAAKPNDRPQPEASMSPLPELLSKVSSNGGNPEIFGQAILVSLFLGIKSYSRAPTDLREFIDSLAVEKYVFDERRDVEIPGLVSYAGEEYILRSDPSYYRDEVHLLGLFRQIFSSSSDSNSPLTFLQVQKTPAESSPMDNLISALGKAVGSKQLAGYARDILAQKGSLQSDVDRDFISFLDEFCCAVFRAEMAGGYTHQAQPKSYLNDDVLPGGSTDALLFSAINWICNPKGACGSAYWVSRILGLRSRNLFRGSSTPHILLPEGYGEEAIKTTQQTLQGISALTPPEKRAEIKLLLAVIGMMGTAAEDPEPDFHTSLEGAATWADTFKGRVTAPTPLQTIWFSREEHRNTWAGPLLSFLHNTRFVLAAQPAKDQVYRNDRYPAELDMITNMSNRWLSEQANGDSSSLVSWVGFKNHPSWWPAWSVKSNWQPQYRFVQHIADRLAVTAIETHGQYRDFIDQMTASWRERNNE